MGGGAQQEKSPSPMCTVCVETSFWSPELCAELMLLLGEAAVDVN